MANTVAILALIDACNKLCMPRSIGSRSYLLCLHAHELQRPPCYYFRLLQGAALYSSLWYDDWRNSIVLMTVAWLKRLISREEVTVAHVVALAAA